MLFYYKMSYCGIYSEYFCGVNLKTNTDEERNDNEQDCAIFTD